MSLPADDALALAGIGFIGIFALWKMQIAPRLSRRSTAAPNI